MTSLCELRQRQDFPEEEPTQGSGDGLSSWMVLRLQERPSMPP
eukprot:CAMPEP_0184312438 /NCGR_PEP_ID=MMETSP1049-20130417/50292_1 /TAXON_ID=77928 /ORGANISM="Proteomonas sulcata, Strain CCMP704" /LENGTH=42 /DNA_ID= /DNA_START= /DNA_END= /DNA_ORIENTATION=